MTSSLKARRELLKATLRAFDTSIARHPSDGKLKTRRAELARELEDLVVPGEAEWMRRRLVELEAEMERVVSGARRMQDLIREHEQLQRDLSEAERWETK